ncbi:hypothetical protein [Pseudomonas sp. TCU-HL1]|uniref:hypothetical protein n=1 Tax=Pseudomonas sp. TCU-HL1 TaxID=1856685 RepID=UPI00083E2244|nr:hypothetical protein [Pseudomonas sp. TCU-HL1]AOE87955.1 hypothetical protein THL1_5408 [Pseudomonas sp. TCU-HL1]
MRTYKIKVTYTRKSLDKKEIELECNEYPVASIVDSFIIEEIMTREEPNLLSIYPLIKSVPRGAEASRMPSNKELMELHGISDLVYEIDERLFCITT